MRILTIMGSPKKNGKTAAALKLLEDKITSRGHEVDRVNITDYKINGCLGCFACMAKADQPGCVQKDDASVLIEKMISADAIVLSSPIYSFFLSAQVKPFIDRCFCLTNTPLLKEKRAALLTTCAGKSEGNSNLAEEFFRRAFDGAHGGHFPAEVIGTYTVDQSSLPDFEARAETVAEKMASDILNA